MVQHFGVDPTWLLIGDYNGVTHREALEDPATVARLLARTALRNDLLERTALSDLAESNGLRRDRLAARAD